MLLGPVVEGMGYGVDCYELRLGEGVTMSQDNKQIGRTMVSLWGIAMSSTPV